MDFNFKPFNARVYSPETGWIGKKIESIQEFLKFFDSNEQKIEPFIKYGYFPSDETINYWRANANAA
jgi:ABC-type phosphate transport system substrate-binding protein